MDFIQIAQDLIRFDSTSRNSNVEITDYVDRQLSRLGFEIERFSYRDDKQIEKATLVAVRRPLRTSPAQKSNSGVAYLAHTDVVPADDWAVDFCDPFDAIVRDERLWGRGSCDMKGSLACALAAAAKIDVGHQTAPLYFVVTSDEEVGMQGAKTVDAESALFQEMVDNKTVGIVGEPTHLKVVHAHKGGYSFWLTSRGISAHSSTREGINANVALVPVLNKLVELHHRSQTDRSLQNDMFDPPTLSWNFAITNNPVASNITPALARCLVFLRPMPGVHWQALVDQVKQVAADHAVDFQERFTTNPLILASDSLVVKKMLEITGTQNPETVCYATDGGILNRLENMLVCGPGDIAQAHRNDEWISLHQMSRGTEIYQRAFTTWSCCSTASR